MRYRKIKRQWTAGIDRSFDSSEAEIEKLDYVVRHGGSFDARISYASPEPEFIGPSFCFRD